MLQNKFIWNGFILPLDILKNQLQILVEAQAVTDLMPLKITLKNAPYTSYNGALTEQSTLPFRFVCTRGSVGGPLGAAHVLLGVSSLGHRANRSASQLSQS